MRERGPKTLMGRQWLGDYGRPITRIMHVDTKAAALLSALLLHCALESPTG